MQTRGAARRIARASVAAVLLVSGVALGESPAEKQAKPQPTLEQLIEELEQQRQALAQQQKQLAEQEKKLQEYKESLQRALAQDRLRIQELEAQRGAGPKATAAAAASPDAAVDPETSEREATKKKGTAAPAVVAQAKPESGPQVPDKPAGQPPESATRPPEIAQVTQYPGVLTPRGKFVLEPDLEYAHSSSDRVSVFGLTILPAITIGLIDINSVNSDLFIASLTGRYGLTDRLELEMKVPYVYRQDSTTARPLATPAAVDSVFNSEGNGLGDIEFTARYQLNRGGPGTPFYVGSLRFKTTTGTGPFDVTTVAAPGLGRGNGADRIAHGHRILFNPAGHHRTVPIRPRGILRRRKLRV